MGENNWGTFRLSPDFLSALHRFFGSISQPRHSGSRAFSLKYVTLHRFRLFSGGFYGLSQFLSLIGINPELEKSNQNDGQRRQEGMPVIRRFFIAIFGLLIGFRFCLWGWDCFDHKRRLLGTTFVASGFLIAATGLLLFWLTNFTWSWGWVL